MTKDFLKIETDHGTLNESEERRLSERYLFRNRL